MYNDQEMLAAHSKIHKLERENAELRSTLKFVLSGLSGPVLSPPMWAEICDMARKALEKLK